MMSSAVTTLRSSASPSMPKEIWGDNTRGVLSCQHRGPAITHNKNVPKSANGNPPRRPPYPKRCPNNEQNVLLHRLSLPSSPPLLERIGGSAGEEAEVGSTLADSNTSDEESAGLGYHTDPFPAEPGEVERFLESVISTPPLSPSPSMDPAHACLGDKPTLALETRNLSVDRPVKVQDPSGSILYSPTQTAVNSLSSPTLDHCQSPLLGDTMSPSLPPVALEECRKHLVPVLLASTQARDPAKRLDSEQCARLLSDDHCKNLFRQAKQMRLQLSSLLSQKAPVYQGWNGSPSKKRDRADDVDARVRSTRTRFDSGNTVVSDVSRKDSDITLVDFPGGKLPPKAPRAMLLASQATLNKSLNTGQNRAPDEGPPIVSSLTETQPPSSTPLLDLVHQALRMFPTLTPAGQTVPTEMGTSDVPVEAPAGDPSAQPGPAPASPSPIHAVPPSSSTTDFVSQLPTQPGIWFRQQGREYAQIVDINIDVSDEMFYVSKERLRVHLRLCSVPVSAARVQEKDSDGNPPASLQKITDVIERHAVHWPKKGNLVVQVNPESERSKTWLPYTLESDPLDVTSCMRPGKNTFRFIQLSDLSGFTFVLAASPPPPEEEWRSWDWASLTQRPDPRSRSDEDMNGLSEFARIPVTLRS